MKDDLVERALAKAQHATEDRRWIGAQPPIWAVIEQIADNRRAKKFPNKGPYKKKRVSAVAQELILSALQARGLVIIGEDGRLSFPTLDDPDYQAKAQFVDDHVPPDDDDLLA